MRTNAASAIAVTMVMKAMEGDFKAATWLRDTGFDRKVEVETQPEEPPHLAELRNIVAALTE